MPVDRLEIKVAIQVSRPAHEVYEAIVDPGKMSRYFISWGSGRLEEGNEVRWRFPEFDAEFPIRVGRLEKDRYISYHWEADGRDLQVEMTLSPQDGSTVVTVTEKAMENDEAGIKWLKANTEGWANFLACLKAYLEHGVNLRRGAFDYMRS